jgi:hypothetical protein
LANEAEAKSIAGVELYAWIGEDELGSGTVGLKQALCPAGIVPMVAVEAEKIKQDYIAAQMNLQAAMYGKTIRLCRFALVEVLLETPVKQP